ncbi:MAG TPA: hypothetical protein VF721_17130 [Pyrinomonadaceae bacterium]|jgi:hypothetical protein
MKNQRKLFLRTETFERILIRSKDTKSKFREASKETVDPPPKGEKYRLEIYRIEAGGEQKVFECVLSGSIEIVETNEDF